MKNQEYLQYAHHYNIEPEEVITSDMELVNINGQLVPVLSDIR